MTPRLKRLELPELDELLGRHPPTVSVSELLKEAEQRIDQFLHGRRARPIHNFVASDYVAAWACLSYLVESPLLAGQRFCEWGCGFGVATLLAAELGFDACGLDVEAELIEHARELADDFDLPAEFVVGSFVPRGATDLIEDLDDVAHLDIDMPDGYDELGLEIDDFDLLYVYPWPGEERFVEDLAAHYGASGALLLAYHGTEGLSLHRR